MLPLAHGKMRAIAFSVVLLPQPLGHQAQSLAVTLWARHSKVAGQIFLQRGALAVADDRHRHPVETGHAA